MGYKKRALALLDFLRTEDPAGEGMAVMELQRKLGWSRPLIMGSLTFLEDAAVIAEKDLDQAKHRLWIALPEEHQEPAQELRPGAAANWRVLHELIGE